MKPCRAIKITAKYKHKNYFLMYQTRENFRYAKSKYKKLNLTLE